MATGGAHATRHCAQTGGSGGEPQSLRLGLAPIVARRIFEILARINREKRLAILVVEQNVALALKHASYGYVLENDRVAVEGTAAELADRGLVTSRYLGH